MALLYIYHMVDIIYLFSSTFVSDLACTGSLANKVQQYLPCFGDIVTLTFGFKNP